MDGEPLAGGLANVGEVRRLGDFVERPAPPHARSVHRLFAALREGGFDGAPTGGSVDGAGRERLEFIPGDVPIQPYPQWALTDEALQSVGQLLRRYHEAARRVPIDASDAWPVALADPAGGSIVCHNDVCLENVVFRGGNAAALIDFDFAAPGRPLWDVAMTARYWVPMLDSVSAAATDRSHLDPIARVGVLANGYGLSSADRSELVDVFLQTHDVARAFVEERVEQGDRAFVDAWDRLGGTKRWERIRAWLETSAGAMTATLVG